MSQSPSPIELTSALLRVQSDFNLLGAELGRILGWKCPQITAFAKGELQLDPLQPEWRRANNLLALHRWLEGRFPDDSVALYHWLHRPLAGFDGVTAHRLMIDQDRLEELLVTLGIPLPTTDDKPATGGTDPTQSGRGRS